MSAPEVSWATGWYIRKRHVHQTQPVRPYGSVPAICSQHASVYPNGLTNRGAGYGIPVADSPEVMALPACKLCLHRIEVTT